MRDEDGRSGGSVSSTFVQGVFIAILTPAVAGLGYIYSAEVEKVNNMGIDVAKVQTLLAATLDLDKRIETDLANISSKYIDEQVTIQSLKGDEHEMSDAIVQMKLDIDRERQSHITEINEFRKRLDQVENTIAPIRGSDQPSHNR